MPFLFTPRCGRVTSAGISPIQQVAFPLSNSPLSPMAYSSSRKMIFFGGQGNSHVMRWNTATDVQAADLVVAGAATLTICAYNPGDDFLYVVDGFNLRKINPSTGALVSTLALTASPQDLLYVASGNYIFASFGAGSASIDRFDTSGAKTNFATANGIQFMTWASNVGKIVATRNGSANLSSIDPATGVETAIANATGYAGISYGTISGKIVLGASLDGTPNLATYDPVANAFGAVTGSSALIAINKVSGIGYSNGVHFAVSEATGLCQLVSDNNFGSVLGQMYIGDSTNRVVAIAAETYTYVPAYLRGALTKFK